MPAGNKPGGRPLRVNVFLGHPGLRLINTPQAYVTRVPIDDVLPAFWLAAGAQDRPDVIAAENFRQLLQTRVANVPFMMVPGGGHQGSVWRAALGPMLRWMTPPAGAAGREHRRRRGPGAAAAGPPPRARRTPASPGCRTPRRRPRSHNTAQGRSASEMTARPFSSSSSGG